MFNGPRFLVRILVIIFAGTTRLFGALLKKPEVKWNIQRYTFSMLRYLSSRERQAYLHYLQAYGFWLVLVKAP